MCEQNNKEESARETGIGKVNHIGPYRTYRTFKGFHLDSEFK